MCYILFFLLKHEFVSRKFKSFCWKTISLSILCRVYLHFGISIFDTKYKLRFLSFERCVCLIHYEYVFGVVTWVFMTFNFYKTLCNYTRLHIKSHKNHINPSTLICWSAVWRSLPIFCMSFFPTRAHIVSWATGIKTNSLHRFSYFVRFMDSLFSTASPVVLELPLT